MNQYNFQWIYPGQSCQGNIAPTNCWGNGLVCWVFVCWGFVGVCWLAECKTFCQPTVYDTVTRQFPSEHPNKQHWAWSVFWRATSRNAAPSCQCHRLERKISGVESSLAGSCGSDRWGRNTSPENYPYFGLDKNYGETFKRIQISVFVVLRKMEARPLRPVPSNLAPVLVIQAAFVTTTTFL